MNDNANEDYRQVDSDSPTGEYPALDETLALIADATPRLNGLERETRSADEAGATFWLSHLETEIARLHGKWAHVDAEFKAREGRITQLQEQLTSSQQAADELAEQLRERVAALAERDERIARKDAEAAALAAELEARGSEVQEAAAAAAATAETRRAVEQELASARSEITLLRSAVERERSQVAALQQRIETLTAEGHALREKLQDLETHIDGRQRSWNDLTAQLADYKDALAGMNKTLKSKDRAAERHERDKRDLAAKIVELERETSELNGRRKEREAAYEELQKKLAQHFETTEQLKADFAKRSRETEHALAKAVDDRKLVESLERAIARRDENLATLEAALEQQRAALDELGGARDKLSKQVAELESGVEDRAEHMQRLREELRSTNEQLRALQQVDAAREAESARSREAADENARLAQRLREELTLAKREGAERAEELRRAGQRAAELDAARVAAIAETAACKAELAAERNLVASLEAEARARQAALDVLQRNVRRISELGASVAALDRQLGSEPAASPSPKLDLDVGAPDPGAQPDGAGAIPDFVATLAAADVAPVAAAVAEPAPSELLPSTAFLEDEQAPHFDVGVPLNDADGGRPRLVATIDGEAVSYPLGKPEITIGRGRRSDIRIASHYISRLHARITTQGIGIMIEDAGSKNGILVNAERVQRCILHDGDVVSLGGELDLRFVDARH